MAETFIAAESASYQLLARRVCRRRGPDCPETLSASMFNIMKEES